MGSLLSHRPYQSRDGRNAYLQIRVLMGESSNLMDDIACDRADDLIRLFFPWRWTNTLMFVMDSTCK
jgi:hypothetical protein